MILDMITDLGAGDGAEERGLVAAERDVAGDRGYRGTSLKKQLPRRTLQ